MTIPPDRIQLCGIRAKGYHGVLPGERIHGQEFVVDLSLELDLRPAAAGDDLGQTVDYGTVALGVAELISEDRVNLIETLAEQIAAYCLSFSAVDAVDVTVHKPSAPVLTAVSDVAVLIRRER